MLRLRLKLRYNGWDAGTAAAGEPGARRAAAVEAQGTQGGGEYEVCF